MKTYVISSKFKEAKEEAKKDRSANTRQHKNTLLLIIVIGKVRKVNCGKQSSTNYCRKGNHK